MEAKVKFKTVEEYINSFPPGSRKLLKEMRKAIRSVVPGAEEVISYNMPAFKLNGILVWYAAYNHHIGFYPFTSSMTKFKKELSSYEKSKGTIRFPLDQPLPLDLIRKLVESRVKEDEQKEKSKKKDLSPRSR